MSDATRAERKQRLGVGTIQVLLAECLVFPLGLITAAYIGRALGPRDYGIFAVALATGDVIEWTMISLFSRATVQVVSEAVDWRAVAAAAFRQRPRLRTCGAPRDRLVWPVTTAALVALVFVVPRYGAMGAAIVVAVASLTGAGILLETVRQVWGVGLPMGTFVRTVVVSAVTLFAGLSWPAYGAWIVLKTLVFVGGIIGALAVTGEFTKEDVQLTRGLL